MEKFTFFWKNRSPFSQWFQDAPFTVNGIRFRDAETYMMWFKDQVFGGTLEKEILATTKPSDVKALGRLVPGFSEPIWNAVAKHGVFYGNLAKFTQNPHILKALMDTAGTTLVEASPQDTIWGIGLTEEDPRAYNRKTWLGTNWLGEVLTDVRHTIWKADTSLWISELTVEEVGKNEA